MNDGDILYLTLMTLRKAGHQSHLYCHYCLICGKYFGSNCKSDIFCSNHSVLYNMNCYFQHGKITLWLPSTTIQQIPTLKRNAFLTLSKKEHRLSCYTRGEVEILKQICLQLGGKIVKSLSNNIYFQSNIGIGK